MKDRMGIIRICERCGQTYTEPAQTGADGKLVCPTCASRDAMTRLGISREEQEHILQAMQGAR